MQIVTASDETQIQISAHLPMSHAKPVTEGSRKNPDCESFLAARETKTVPQKNHGEKGIAVSRENWMRK